MLATTRNKNLTIHMLPIEAIDVPAGHRATDDWRLICLVQSIEVQGLLQPIAVRRHPELAGRYILVYGHYRMAALVKLDFHEIEAMILDIDAEGAEIAGLSENYFRIPGRKPRTTVNRWRKFQEKVFTLIGQDKPQSEIGGDARPPTSWDGEV